MKDKIDEMIKSLDTWHSDKVRGHKVYFADAVLEGLNDLFPKCQNNNIKDSPQSNLELVKGERNNSSEDISKGCGNIIGKTKEGFRKFCGVHGLCPKCQEKYTKKYSKRNGIQEKERRIESPDYPESKEEWEECGWDIDKEEQKFKSEEKEDE